MLEMSAEANAPVLGEEYGVTPDLNVRTSSLDGVIGLNK